MRFTNLFEARHIGSSRYIQFVMTTLEQIDEYLDVLAREKRRRLARDDWDDWETWQEIGQWLNKKFNIGAGSVEDIFTAHMELDGAKEASNAVSDLTERFGQPGMDDNWGEQVYTWVYNKYKIQVFVSPDHPEDEDFLIITHEYSFNPEDLELI